ncbi:hypothetical protein HDU76_001592 [Blyttiomyces sp. JEL0837]|nr:hypothetical protein HDU76_001592 [Blyttiomyces sp. JEL0837]
MNNIGGKKDAGGGGTTTGSAMVVNAQQQQQQQQNQQQRQPSTTTASKSASSILNTATRTLTKIAHRLERSASTSSMSSSLAKSKKVISKKMGNKTSSQFESSAQGNNPTSTTTTTSKPSKGNQKKKAKDNEKEKDVSSSSPHRQQQQQSRSAVLHPKLKPDKPGKKKKRKNRKNQGDEDGDVEREPAASKRSVPDVATGKDDAITSAAPAAAAAAAVPTTLKEKPRGGDLHQDEDQMEWDDGVDKDGNHDGVEEQVDADEGDGEGDKENTTTTTVIHPFLNEIPIFSENAVEVIGFTTTCFECGLHIVPCEACGSLIPIVDYSDTDKHPIQHPSVNDDPMEMVVEGDVNTDSRQQQRQHQQCKLHLPVASNSGTPYLPNLPNQPTAPENDEQLQQQQTKQQQRKSPGQKLQDWMKSAGRVVCCGKCGFVTVTDHELRYAAGLVVDGVEKRAWPMDKEGLLSLQLTLGGNQYWEWKLNQLQKVNDVLKKKRLHARLNVRRAIQAEKRAAREAAVAALKEKEKEKSESGGASRKRKRKRDGDADASGKDGDGTRKKKKTGNDKVEDANDGGNGGGGEPANGQDKTDAVAVAEPAPGNPNDANNANAGDGAAAVLAPVVRVPSAVTVSMLGGGVIAMTRPVIVAGERVFDRPRPRISGFGGGVGLGGGVANAGGNAGNNGGVGPGLGAAGATIHDPRDKGKQKVYGDGTLVNEEARRRCVAGGNGVEKPQEDGADGGAGADVGAGGKERKKRRRRRGRGGRKSVGKEVDVDVDVDADAEVEEGMEVDEHDGEERELADGNKKVAAMADVEVVIDDVDKDEQKQAGAGEDIGAERRLDNEIEKEVDGANDAYGDGLPKPQRRRRPRRIRLPDFDEVLSSTGIEMLEELLWEVRRHLTAIRDRKVPVVGTAVRGSLCGNPRGSYVGGDGGSFGGMKFGRFGMGTRRLDVDARLGGRDFWEVRWLFEEGCVAGNAVDEVIKEMAQELLSIEKQVNPLHLHTIWERCLRVVPPDVRQIPQKPYDDDQQSDGNKPQPVLLRRSVTMTRLLERRSLAVANEVVATVGENLKKLEVLRTEIRRLWGVVVTWQAEAKNAGSTRGSDVVPYGDLILKSLGFKTEQAVPDPNQNHNSNESGTTTTRGSAPTSGSGDERNIPKSKNVADGYGGGPGPNENSGKEDEGAKMKLAGLLQLYRLWVRKYMIGG